MRVIWDKEKCSHSGNCVRGLPEVFKIKDGAFVIEPKNSTSERIERQVAACPSGALKLEKEKGSS